jgi:hypothetical protein
MSMFAPGRKRFSGCSLRARRSSCCASSAILADASTLVFCARCGVMMTSGSWLKGSSLGQASGPVALSTCRFSAFSLKVCYDCPEPVLVNVRL